MFLPAAAVPLGRAPIHSLVGGFYFATESSNPISIAEYFRQKLLKAALKAGLMTKRKGATRDGRTRSIRTGFRDTFAAALLNGVPIEMVSKLLGHSSIKITEERPVDKRASGADGNRVAGGLGFEAEARKNGGQCWPRVYGRLLPVDLILVIPNQDDNPRSVSNCNRQVPSVFQLPATPLYL